MMKESNSLTDSRKIGQKGETLACQYLENKGYRILFRNWQYMHRELDIVAVCQKELVFVEVKTREAGCIIQPQEAVNKRKQKFLVSAANLFIQKHEMNMEVRFDIISIIYSGNSYKIEHIENAFYPQVS